MLFALVGRQDVIVTGQIPIQAFLRSLQSGLLTCSWLNALRLLGCQKCQVLLLLLGIVGRLIETVLQVGDLACEVDSACVHMLEHGLVQLCITPLYYFVGFFGRPLLGRLLSLSRAAAATKLGL